MPKVHKKIAPSKCKRCRHDRQKCLPKDRIWPGVSCDRCQKYGYECSANRSVTQEAAIENENAGPAMVTTTPIENLSSSVLLQQIYDLRWMEEGLEQGLADCSTFKWGMQSLISRLLAEKEDNMRARERQCTDVDALAESERLADFEERLLGLWDVSLQDVVISQTHLKFWIQYCHTRKDLYQRRYDFWNAGKVQFHLVNQLHKCREPETLNAETTTLFEMYKQRINRCSSLHPSLEDLARFCLLAELLDLEIYEGHIKSNDAFIEATAIRTLFTELPDSLRADTMNRAIYQDCSWAIEAYLDTGMDINKQLESGMSLLHLAGVYSSYNAVRLLIEKGADVLAINTNNGKSALHYVVSRSPHAATAKTLATLLDTKLSTIVNLREDSGQDALDLARKVGNRECIELLQKAVSRQMEQSESQLTAQWDVHGVGDTTDSTAVQTFPAMDVNAEQRSEDTMDTSLA